MRRIPLYKFENWLRSKGLSENTIDQYVYYFAKFVHDDITQETISEFLSHKGNRNSVARSFIKNMKKYVVTHYKELGYSKEEVLETNLIDIPIVTGRTPNKKILPITLEEVFQIEKQLPNEKRKLMLLISFYCALRVSELLTLRVESVQWTEWSKDTSKMCECLIDGKGGKQEYVFIPPKIATRLGKYIKGKPSQYSDPKQFIFLVGEATRDNIKSKSTTWGRYLSQAAEKANITQHVHPHLLRHSAASYLINEKKMDSRRVQEALRHSSITSTQIYTHIKKDDLKEELSQIF